MQRVSNHPLWVMCLISMGPWLQKAAPALGQACQPVQLPKLIASDGLAGDRFGHSVSIDGEIAVIGAPEGDAPGIANSGCAYVFIRSAGGWIPMPKLFAADAESVDRFGVSVAVSAETIIVGARLDDHDGGTNAGSAYVFVRSGNDWTQQAKLTADDAAAGDDFGIYVAIDGDTAIVGARLDDHVGGINAGSAYVFVRSGNDWMQQAKLTAADAEASDSFGWTVSISGDTAVVGAHDDNHDGGADAGSAYVFVRSGSSWTQQAKLVASDAAAADSFGFSVSISSDTLAIGAYQDDDGGSESGSVYLFTRSGGVWTQQQKLTPSDFAAGDRFGHSVLLNGHSVLVGALLADSSAVDSGAAYLFVLAGGVWGQQAKLVALDAAGDDGFGLSVALSDDAAVVGAYQDDDSGNESGSAYVVELQCDDDGDGVPNPADNCPSDPNKTEPGACGCGNPDTDTDSDGTADCDDGCPSDPSKTATGICGCGVVDTIGFVGFLPPIGGADATGGSFADPLRAFKLGSTIPVKFVGSRCASPLLAGIHSLQAIKFSSAVDADAPIDATPVDAATPGNQFRLADGEWHFNLSTRTGFSTGTWKLIATLSDGSEHYVWITLKK